MRTSASKRRSTSPANRAGKRPAEANGHSRRLKPHVNGKTRQPFRPVLITGGAGFVGTNLAAHLLRRGQRVLIFDNLSRPGVQQNLQWLVQQFPSTVDFLLGDIRDARAVQRAVSCAQQVYHFAAQVAVTTSLTDPTTDFEINAHGTLNVLEAVRHSLDPPPLLFTSTNKVYGNLNHLELSADELRYGPTQRETRLHGIGERQPLDFHSPYGCSKGVADQYVLDYARCFDLPAVVFRMSCIYGPHQCGTEDQGWVAHFLLQALEQRLITVYGDGKQVRDTLFVEDLVQAMVLALEHIDYTRGCAFNMGGGPDNTLSLLELIDLIEHLHGSRPDVQFRGWRAGDQRYYISDTRAFQAVSGWSPQVGVAEGVERLYQWLRRHCVVPRSAELLQQKVG